MMMVERSDTHRQSANHRPGQPACRRCSLDSCVGWRSVVMGIAALNAILRFGLRRL